jgi:hypothetical protein
MDTCCSGVADSMPIWELDPIWTRFAIRFGLQVGAAFRADRCFDLNRPRLLGALMTSR